MLFKDKLKEPVIYKGSNKATEELNQIQEYFIWIFQCILEELLSIKGFGPKKCDWYGKDILDRSL